MKCTLDHLCANIVNSSVVILVISLVKKGEKKAYRTVNIKSNDLSLQ